LANNDRERLKRISLEIARHLCEEGPHIGIVPLKRVREPNLEIQETETNGWCALVGSISLSGTREVWIEIWLDHWTTASRRRFYCGFAGSDAALLEVVAAAPERYEPRRVFTRRDMATGEYARLKQELPKSLLGCPIHERLGSHGFFGLYFHEPLSTDQARSAFARNAVDFFVTCSDAVIQAGREDDFPAVTERRLVTLHKRAEFARNGSLAKRRKQKDNYTCEVCLLRLEDHYGPLGREYAEAHHIVPLHQLGDEVETTIDDLITVCPNCHRMLHRMPGNAHDWIKLQKVIAKHIH
jgi:5-methylcytosine-specific restriction endonuclease McrA